MSVETITLGCRVNFAESETIARFAPAGEDWIVVNSCAVTNEAVRQTRQAIRHARRQRPSAKILVTGCAAELDRRSFEIMPEVMRVVGNSHKSRIVELVSSAEYHGQIHVGDIFTPQDFESQLDDHLGSAFQFEPILTQSAWFRPHNVSEDIKNFYLVGAVARDVWMSGIHKIAPRRTTTDIDFAVLINDKGTYEALKEYLIININ